MSYSVRDVIAHVQSNLTSIGRLSFTPRCDIAEIIREELDSGNYDAPAVIYNNDAWEVINSGDFSHIVTDTDFSDCESGQDCVAKEAGEIIRESYREQLDTVLNEIANAVGYLFTLTDIDFPGASKYSIDEIHTVDGCALGYISHAYEFDTTEGAAESACVWLRQRQIYIKVHGMEFQAELIREEEAETEE